MRYFVNNAWKFWNTSSIRLGTCITAVKLEFLISLSVCRGSEGKNPQKSNFIGVPSHLIEFDEIYRREICMWVLMNIFFFEKSFILVFYWIKIKQAPSGETRGFLFQSLSQIFRVFGHTLPHILYLEANFFFL